MQESLEVLFIAKVAIVAIYLGYLIVTTILKHLLILLKSL